MLIQVLKHINWLGLLYFLANNGIYQVLFAKYNEQQNRQRIERRGTQNNGQSSQIRSEVVRKISKQNIIFAILVVSWFLHNAVSLYVLDFEKCGKAIYERLFQEHMDYIKYHSHIMHTEFIKSILCEQFQIALALILVALCFIHKNSFWKALFFLVIYHLMVSYRAANQEINPVMVEAETRKVNKSGRSSSLENVEYYEEIIKTNVIDTSQYENSRIEEIKNEVKDSEVNIEVSKKEEKEESSTFSKPANEKKKSVTEEDEKKNCFKKLSWLAYIPLKTISIGFEVACDAGELFEYLVCEWIIG